MATDKMSDEMIQAYGRLTAHELAIEVMMANWVASMPEDGAKAFIEDFRLNSLLLSTSPEKTVDDSEAAMVIQDAVQMIDHLLDKVVHRSISIRAVLAQRSSGQ